MKNIPIVIATSLLIGSVSHGRSIENNSNGKPNILIIVADDMGYSDISPFGSEIATPNLASLAQHGTVLANFHVAPACSPTRSMLLTGRDNHLAGVGVMAEDFVRKPQLQAYPGYQGYLTPNLPTIADRLRALGYSTFMAGKWHLGEAEGQSPQERGFDRSYVLLNGAGNHYGADQGGAWLNTRAVTRYRNDGKLTKFPVGRYSTDFYTDQIIKYLEIPLNRPFFAYLAYTAPHWPLQAPPASILKYHGRYDQGWEVLRKERWKRAQALGLIPPDASERDLPPLPDWNSLSREDQRVEARKMEIYAAMIDRMDEQIGRVLAILRQQGRLKNTIVLFMSDNGPAATGPGPDYLSFDQDNVKRLGIDNGIDNLGSGSSYVSYHQGWAITSATPFKGTKGSTYEGGIRTSAIIAGPGIPEGRIERHFAHVMDVMPTLLHMVGQASKRPGLDRGGSWNFLVSNPTSAKQQEGRETGWELGLNQAIRVGDWKAVLKSPFNRLAQFNGQARSWELYDLARDPSEAKDESRFHPKNMSKLKKIWNSYAKKNGVLNEDKVISAIKSNYKK